MRPPFALALLCDVVPHKRSPKAKLLAPLAPLMEHTGFLLRAENSALHSGHFDGSVVRERSSLRLPDEESDSQGILNFSDDLTSGRSDVQIGMLHHGIQHRTLTDLGRKEPAIWPISPSSLHSQPVPPCSVRNKYHIVMSPGLSLNHPGRRPLPGKHGILHPMYLYPPVIQSGVRAGTPDGAFDTAPGCCLPPNPATPAETGKSLKLSPVDRHSKVTCSLCPSRGRPRGLLSIGEDVATSVSMGVRSEDLLPAQKILAGRDC